MKEEVTPKLTPVSITISGLRALIII